MPEYLDKALPIIEKDLDTAELKATRYFEDYLYRIIQAVGGEGSQAISELNSASLQSDKVPYLFGLVNQLILDTAKFNTIIRQTNYTAKNKDFVEGRGNITLKFPKNAVRGDEVIFANGGGIITADGNGNDIKFTSTDTTLVMRQKGTSFHFHFFEDNVLNERYWRAR